MRSLRLLIITFFFSVSALAQELPVSDTVSLSGIQVSAVVAGNKVPVTKTNFTKEELLQKNIGQDLPFILQSTPGLVANSDAGNGVGYTGLRLRGTDATRINVTLNGIPYNDAESQGTFLVNIPDIVASASGIQVQRGVGTSSNGPGAFGGSIHILTNEAIKESKVLLHVSGGSFGTLRTSIAANSGLLNKKILIDTRASYIRSNGYVDRATSNLKSFYNSIAYLGKRSSLRLNFLYGNERTYQAYYGVSNEQLNNNRTFNSAGTAKPGAPYKNEVDDYAQTHLQLFYDYKFSNSVKTNVAGYYTYGTGYYEQYKSDAKLEDYGLMPVIQGMDTIKKTDLVRRLWLRNNLLGLLYNIQYAKNNTELVLGGNLSTYAGNHFGKIVESITPKLIVPGYKFYDLNAKKTEASFYTKWTQTLAQSLYGFIDLQFRKVNYNINGFRNNPTIITGNTFNFFNPKAGVKYNGKTLQAYLTYGRAGKEPNRDDFETSPTTKPKAEKLNDVELGIAGRLKKLAISTTLYHMSYKDQLVLTGGVNDVGAYTRTNVKNSYRMGIETEIKYTYNKKISFTGNLALSRNKLKGYTELVDDYDNGGQKENFYSNPDIAFSPTVVSYAAVQLIPIKNLEFSLQGKYVSRQFLDNTNTKSRSLNAYYNQDLLVRYSCGKTEKKKAVFYTQVNNILNRKYEPNGYTFSYITGGSTVTENYYFPMSGTSVIVGMQFSL